MRRCDACGRRWCVCIPAGASVDWFSGRERSPVYGPWPRGQDSVMEILETAADIAELHPDEHERRERELVAAYPASALAEALTYAHMMGHRLGGRGGAL